MNNKIISGIIAFLIPPLICFLIQVDNYGNPMFMKTFIPGHFFIQAILLGLIISAVISLVIVCIFAVSNIFED